MFLPSAASQKSHGLTGALRAPRWLYIACFGYLSCVLGGENKPWSSNQRLAGTAMSGTRRHSQQHSCDLLHLEHTLQAQGRNNTDEPTRPHKEWQTRSLKNARHVRWRRTVRGGGGAPSKHALRSTLFCCCSSLYTRATWIDGFSVHNRYRRAYSSPQRTTRKTLSR